LAARILGVAAGDLPLEGTIGSFDGATAWLNSAPLTSAFEVRPAPVETSLMKINPFPW